MPDIIELDFETRSRADIKKVGAFKYAEDPSTEIICAALSWNGAPPVMWVNPKFEGQSMVDGQKFHTEHGAQTIMLRMDNPDVEIHAHNAQFETAIILNKGRQHGFVIDSINQMRCTAAMCRRANIPASLDKAGETLNLDTRKDKRGSDLIKLFSIPNKKTGQFNDPLDHPEEFRAFLEYCRRDVVVESLIEEKLKHFALKGPVLEAFQLDMAMNCRGLEINLDAVRNADAIIQEAEADLSRQFRELTGLEHGQTKRLLPWLQEQGYSGKNLTADSIEEELEDEEFDESTTLGRALRLKQMLSFAATKKLRAMLVFTCADSRARGTIQFYGAQTTGRGAGRGIQPQNFKRPDTKTIRNMPWKERGFKKDSDALKWFTQSVYADICGGLDTSTFWLLYGNPIEGIASCIRHFIHPHDGRMFFDVDFSNIEARIICWVAGQEDVLQEYREGIDQYKKLAAFIYSKPASEVNDFPERFVGKQAKLGCGYGMGPPKFRITCKKYKYDLPCWVTHIPTGRKVWEGTDIEEARAFARRNNPRGRDVEKPFVVEGMEDIAVKAFRDTHQEIKKFWRACDVSAKQAIKNPGEKFAAGRVSFMCAHTAGANYLFITLPSGRRLAYRDPQISMEKVAVDVEDGEEDDGWFTEKETKLREVVTYWGQLKTSVNWGRIKLYGGKYAENCTQAIAADIMNIGAVNAERAGFPIATMIHDQCLAYGSADMAENKARLPILKKCMTTMPRWADGLPVEVDAKITPYYIK